MSKADIIFWLSSLSAGVAAVTAIVTSYPGDVVPQIVTILLLAVSAGLAAMVAFATRQQG
jgi:hypothetical protein